MEDALAKIRPHTSSSLPHQKTPANLLVALESTLKEQHTDLTPTAYFAAVLTTLDGTIQNKPLSCEEGDILPAELYLLALVAPFVPPSVIRVNSKTLIALTAPLFPLLNQHAPALRSQLSIYHALFTNLDRTQLDLQGVRQSFATILQLSIDPRPKVRKRAADLVKDILSNPPTPLVFHPYAEQTSEFLRTCLADTTVMPFSKPKGSKQISGPGPESVIHLLAFLKPIIRDLPPSSLPEITKTLLVLPHLGNSYLSQSAYTVLSDIFASFSEAGTVDAGDDLLEVLRTIQSSPPSKSDFILSASWVHVMGVAFVAYGSNCPQETGEELGKVWKCVWGFLDSSDAATRGATAQALSAILSCITPDLIQNALQDNEGISVLRRIISQVQKAVDSIAYAKAMPELFSVISSMITHMNYRSSRTSSTAAEVLLLPLIIRVGDLRISKTFQHKEAADASLSTAMKILGPEALLKALPLNLEPGTSAPGEEPRAFLLPLLAQPHASPLSHFVSYFVPLSERMFDLQQKAEMGGRAAECKVWSVLIGQVWAGLPGYCTESPNIRESLNPAFSQLLTQLLYGQPELRTSILKSLKLLVDSNLSLSVSNQQDPSATVSLVDVQENVAFLRSQVESWLAVFFNLYGSVGRDARGKVGDVVASWLSIAGDRETHNTFLKLLDLFKTNLPMAQKSPNTGGEVGNMSTTAQDILFLILPYLSHEDSEALFSLILSTDVLMCKDNGVQKRGYKLLLRLIEKGIANSDAVLVLQKLDGMTEGLAPAAKKDRLNVLCLLVDLLPPTSMHIIPSLIPEAVLGTKEPSEKARAAAFQVIVAMGKKMSSGGIVIRRLVDGMDEDGAEDTAASIEEFLTMIAGGLAGATPHMISATITALSRLIFEFKDSITSKMHNEIMQTLLVFLSSANREIVKSSLGFVKLAIHTLPVDLLRSHLPELVPSLLNRSHDHKNHFKVKVRHIFERILRRFNWDEVYSYASGEDAAKVLSNIKKRKDRAKRKKASRETGDAIQDESKRARNPTGDAFEDVLYGSESELDDSDDENGPPRGDSSKRKNNTANEMRLRLDVDEPMDLLEGAATRITATQSKRKKPGQDASRFKTQEDTGKIILADDDDSDYVMDSEQGIAGNAYRETLTSVDGFTRGPNGRIKFNKDTKKRRREEDAMDLDVEVDSPNSKAKRSKRKEDPSLGHEFKAQKAGGDVKKAGLDPYAYISLSQAGKQRRGGKQLGITGKR